MNRRLACIAVAAVAMGLTGAAAAQSPTLPHRDDPAWALIGSTEDGTRYSIFPSRTAVEHTTVWLNLKATVAPASDGSPNTVIAHAVVDCRAPGIGVGTVDFYNETQGFLRTVEGPEDPVLRSAPDPGQRLVIRHVCAE